jgi:hypothetical protein
MDIHINSRFFKDIRDNEYSLSRSYDAHHEPVGSLLFSEDEVNDLIVTRNLMVNFLTSK